MNEINISGIIGWDFTADDMRCGLASAGGDAVKIKISSPGGLIGDGLDIFNQIRNYPGETTVVLSGYAMSIASYLPLAADKRLAEDNAVLMIHNAGGGVFGDHNEILKYGGYLKNLSRMIRTAYVRHTNLTDDDLVGMMDQETFFFGAEMVDAGFVTEIIGTSGSDDKNSATAMATMAYRDCNVKLASDLATVKNDMAKAVLMCAASPGGNPLSPKAEKQPENKGEPIMDLKKLRAEYPALVADIAADATAKAETATAAAIKTARDEGVAAGAEAERKRIVDVRAQVIGGHEELIEKLAFDGKSTGADAAIAIVAAEKVFREQALKDIESESPDHVDYLATDDAGGKQAMKRAEFNKMSSTEQAKFCKGGVVVD